MVVTDGQLKIFKLNFQKHIQAYHKRPASRSSFHQADVSVRMANQKHHRRSALRVRFWRQNDMTSELYYVLCARYAGACRPTLHPPL